MDYVLWGCLGGVIGFIVGVITIGISLALWLDRAWR